MSFKYEIARAAKMVETSYLLFKKRPPRTSLDPHVRGKLDKNHVQAVFLKQNILLIPGSNALYDYTRFNLRVMNFGGKTYRLNDELTDKWGAHNVIWHQGFMRHAKVIADWLQQKRYRPKYIIGHSLGAAATQILVRTHDVHGIAFAAPRVTRGTVQPAPASKCLCLNRNDDRVCDLPSSFEHLGEVHSAGGSRQFLRFDHNMDRYQEMVTAQQAAGKLSTHWPA